MDRKEAPELLCKGNSSLNVRRSIYVLSKPLHLKGQLILISLTILLCRKSISDFSKTLHVFRNAFFDLQVVRN